MSSKKFGDINIFKHSARCFKTIGLLTLGSMTGLFALGLGIFSNSAFAENPSSGSTTATSRVAVTLREVISLRILDKTASSEISNLELELTPTPNGVFTRGSFVAEASTSNATGYKLYLTSVGKNHSDTYTNSLINIDSDIDASVGTVPSLVSGTSITETAFRANNSAYKNRWGYSTNGLIVDATTDNGVTTINSITDNTNTSEITYVDIPENTENRQIDEKSKAIDKGITPITIGTNISSAMTSGTYKNALELTAIANPLTVDYSLSFDGNSTGAVTGLPSTMEASSVASSYTFTIPNAVPTTSVSGYMFKEWNTAADGSGDSYAPGDKFTVAADDVTGTDQILYAIWTPVPEFFTITYMQDMTPAICTNTTTPAKTAANADIDGSHDGDVNYVPETTLIDYRGIDGTGSASSPATGSNQISYKVRKLADGNCWMTQNLELPLAAGTKVEASYNTTATAYSFTPTSCGRNGACSMNDNTKAGNGTYYYSWYAATAETGTSADVNTDASASICPIGWRLPANYTIDSSKSYGSLTNAYSFTTNGANNSQNHVAALESSPFNFARSGSYLDGSPYNNGTDGYYWSSTASTSATNAYNFSYSTSGTYARNYYGKYYGFNVRCVAL